MTIPNFKFAKSSCLYIKIDMPFLSTSQHALAQTLPLLPRPQSSPPGFQSLTWPFHEHRSLMASCYMTLPSRVSRRVLHEPSPSFWSHLRLALLFPTFPFLLSSVSPAFPCLLISKIAALINYNSELFLFSCLKISWLNRLLLICSHIFFAPHYALPNNSTAGSMF